MKHISVVIFIVLLATSGIAFAINYSEVGGFSQRSGNDMRTWLTYLVYFQPLLLIGLYFSYRTHLLSDAIVESDQTPIASQPDKILDAVSGCVITVNREHMISYINKAAEQLVGLQGESGMGQPVSYVFDLKDRQGQAIIKSILDDQEKYPERNFRFGQVHLKTKQRDNRYINLSTQSIMAEDSEESHGTVLVFRDVTADRKVMNSLYRQASQDALTGLINRNSFERTLEHILQTSSSDDANHVLVYIDLDHFKIVNDSCGHIAGDELLRQVSQIFLRYVRQIDKVARVGGDEFAILLQSCPLSRAKEIVEFILNDLRSFRFSWQEKNFVVGASMGIVEFNSGVGNSLKGLLNVADQACYIAKKLGRDQYHILDMNMEKAVSESDQGMIDWSKQLKRALEYDEFLLQAQHIVPLQKERLDSISQYEVLIRLPHEENTYRPGSFIPTAERLGLMKDIDKWVITHVLDSIASNQNKGHSSHYRLMINLSADSVQDKNFLEFIKRCFDETGISPSLIGFEVSEPVAVANFSKMKVLFNGLKELGCGRVLDDFGSGFSSLSYLRELPVNYLKIDGAFVRNLASNDVDAAMVKAVNQVGKVMNLFTIAEAVEDEQTLAALRYIGVDFAQGYYCGKPISFDAFCETLENQSEDSML